MGTYMKGVLIFLLGISALSCLGQTDTSPITEAEERPSPEVEMCDFSEFHPVKVSHFVRSRLKVRQSPEYPQKAVDRAVEGIVSVKILVDREGNVVRACALEGDDDLRTAAEEAALKWKFKRNVVPGRDSYVQDGLTFLFLLKKDEKAEARSAHQVVYPSNKTTKPTLLP